MRILGGLMALGYEIGTMLRRSSSVYSDEQLTIKLDDIEGMDKQFVQIQGKDRNQVAAAGKALGLDGTYIARSYIEQVCWRLHMMLWLRMITCPPFLIQVDRVSQEQLQATWRSCKSLEQHCPMGPDNYSQRRAL